MTAPDVIDEPLDLLGSGIKTVYLAGPMRGHKYFNFDEFLNVGQKLQWLFGLRVHNPAANDIDEGFDPWSCPDGSTEELQALGFDLTKALEWDLQHVLRSDAVVVLDGWEASSGARHEVATARLVGKPVYAYEAAEKKLSGEVPTRLVRIDDHVSTEIDVAVDPIYRGHTSVLTATEAAILAETRITNPTTGGMKGMKPARFELIPAWPLKEVAEVYGFGASKYEDRNWEKGYAWSLSYGAMMRHINAWWSGDDFDEESGKHHLAHAIFHCMSCVEWAYTHPELDDRPLDTLDEFTWDEDPVEPIDGQFELFPRPDGEPMDDEAIRALFTPYYQPIDMVRMFERYLALKAEQDELYPEAAALDDNKWGDCKTTVITHPHGCFGTSPSTDPGGMSRAASRAWDVT